MLGVLAWPRPESLNGANGIGAFLPTGGSLFRARLWLSARPLPEELALSRG